MQGWGESRRILLKSIHCRFLRQFFTVQPEVHFSSSNLIKLSRTGAVSKDEEEEERERERSNCKKDTDSLYSSFLSVSKSMSLSCRRSTMSFVFVPWGIIFAHLIFRTCLLLDKVLSGYFDCWENGTYTGARSCPGIWVFWHMVNFWQVLIWNSYTTQYPWYKVGPLVLSLFFGQKTTDLISGCACIRHDKREDKLCGLKSFM